MSDPYAYPGNPRIRRRPGDGDALWRVAFRPGTGDKRTTFRWDGRADCQDEAMERARRAQEDAWGVAMAESGRFGAPMPRQFGERSSRSRSPLARETWQIGGAMRDAIQDTPWRSEHGAGIGQEWAEIALRLGSALRWTNHSIFTYYGVEAVAQRGQEHWGAPLSAAKARKGDRFELRFGIRETLEQIPLDPAAAHAILALSVVPWIRAQWSTSYYFLYDQFLPCGSSTIASGNARKWLKTAADAKRAATSHLESIGAAHAARMLKEIPART